MRNVNLLPKRTTVINGILHRIALTFVGVGLLTYSVLAQNVGIGTAVPATKLDVAAPGNWNTATSEGDVRIGNPTYRLKIGVALGGGGAGDVRMTAAGGTNRLFLGGGTNTNVAVVDGTNQRLGVNTYDPNTTVDVFGDLALKTTAATLTGAAPNYAVNTTTTPRSYYRVATPAANFNITSLTVAAATGTSSSDGRIVTLYNATAFNMTINNQDATAVAANRIITGTSMNLVIGAGGSVTFVYNTTDGRWVVKDYNGAVGGGDWKLDGNNNGALRSIGTNDNYSFPIETNGIERVMIDNVGRVGVGTAPVGGIGVSIPVGIFPKMEMVAEGSYLDFVEKVFGGDSYHVIQRADGTAAAPTIVGNNASVGAMLFYAYDGANYQQLAGLRTYTDGATAAGDMPGRMTFYTTLDGTSTPFERMRIVNNGNVGINTTAPTSKLHVYDAADADKITTYSEGRSTNTGVDWQSIGMMGYGRGASTSWGYGTGILGLGSPSDAWGAIGVFAALGNATPSLDILTGGAYNFALYADGSGLGPAGIFMNGNVGIGTTNPNRAILHQEGMVGNTAAIFGNDGNGISLVSSWPGVYFNAYYNGGTRAMQAGYTGNISIDPTGGRYMFSTGATAASGALATQTERMTILNNGNVGINVAAPTATLQVNGSVIINELAGDNDVRMESQTRPYMFWLDANQNAVRYGSNAGNLWSNGSVINGVTVDYLVDFDKGTADGSTIGIGSVEFLLDGISETHINNDFTPTVDITYDLGFTYAWDDVYADDFWNVSDIRAKKDVKDMSYGLAELMKMRTISYKLKEDPFQEPKVGLVAQEVLALTPELVKTYEYKATDENEPNKLNKVELENMRVNYVSMVPVLIKAIQEQQEMIEKLEEKVAVLEGKTPTKRVFTPVNQGISVERLKQAPESIIIGVGTPALNQRKGQVLNTFSSEEAKGATFTPNMPTTPSTEVIFSKTKNTTESSPAKAVETPSDGMPAARKNK